LAGVDGRRRAQRPGDEVDEDETETCLNLDLFLKEGVKVKILK